MTPQRLQQMLAGDSAQISEAQRWLKAGGYYNGPIDGVAGRGTTSAIAAYRDDHTAESKRLLRQRELENETPYLDAVKEYGPLALGLPGGYYASSKLGQRFTRQRAAKAEELSDLASRRDIDPVTAHRTARRRGLYAPGGFGHIAELGKRMALPGVFLGASEFTREQAEAFPEDHAMREVLDPLAVGERYMALGAATQGAKDWLTRPEPSSAADEAALRSRAREAKKGATAPTGRAPDASSPRTHSEKLKAAVRAAGGPNVKTKAEAEAWLRKNTTDRNRGAIGRALGVQPGRNFTRRLSQTVKDMASRPGMALFAPFGAAGLAYGTARSEAADAGQATPTTGLSEAAIAGGATAGGMAAFSKGAELASRYAPAATRIAARALPPLALGLTAYDLYNSSRPVETEAGTGARSGRRPTPRELGPEQLQQLFQQNRRHMGYR